MEIEAEIEGKDCLKLRPFVLPFACTEAFVPFRFSAIDVCSLPAFFGLLVDKILSLFQLYYYPLISEFLSHVKRIDAKRQSNPT